MSLEMRCGECGCVFCYEHGGAHQGKTCAEYVEATADGACVRAFVRVCVSLSFFAAVVELEKNKTYSSRLYPQIRRACVFSLVAS